MTRKKTIAVLALGAVALASCAQGQPKAPEEIAALAAYDGTWQVDGTLTMDNVAEFEGYRNVVACGTWSKETWTISSGSILGTSRSPGNTQSISGSIAPDGTWNVKVKTTNGIAIRVTARSPAMREPASWWSSGVPAATASTSSS